MKFGAGANGDSALSDGKPKHNNHTHTQIISWSLESASTDVTGSEQDDSTMEAWRDTTRIARPKDAVEVGANRKDADSGRPQKLHVHMNWGIRENVYAPNNHDMLNKGRTDQELMRSSKTMLLLHSGPGGATQSLRTLHVHFAYEIGSTPRGRLMEYTFFSYSCPFVSYSSSFVSYSCSFFPRRSFTY